MIWVAGKLLPDDGLTVNASDLTFEHGLGLFETMRTWGGRATFLAEHRARMLESAESLRIPIDPTHFPDEQAVARLLEATGEPGDRVLRVTASGGSMGVGSVVWMRSRPLPPPVPEGSARVELGRWTLRRDDPLARHKTLNYWDRRVAREDAASRGFDETLGSITRTGYVEGSISNVFAIREGEILTPSLKAPIIPGLMRRCVLEVAEGLSMVINEVSGLKALTILRADEVFLTNSVRAIVPLGFARLAPLGMARHWPAVGPRTRALQQALAGRLDPRGSPS